MKTLGRKKWVRCGKEVPVGTIVIRRHNKVRSRYIKVAMRGRQNERWRPYGRWLWEKCNGLVPPGKRVIHADGNPLNDEPGNLILGTADDVLMLSRDWDSSLDDRNRRNVALATAEHNRVRAEVRRLREWLPTKWYGVDFGAMLIVNVPQRKRSHVWPDHVRDHCAKNGRGADSAAVGFPGRSLFDAILLAVLVDRGEGRMSDLLVEIGRWRKLLVPNDENQELLAGTFYSAICSLKRAGLVKSLQLAGESRHVYLPTAEAVRIRQAGSRLIPVCGSDLIGDERFRSFLRWTPGVNDAEKEKWIASRLISSTIESGSFTLRGCK